MVVPVVIVAVAAGGVAAATGVYFLIRRLVRGSQPQDAPYPFPQALPLEHLPKYDKTRPLGQMEFIMMQLHEMDKGTLSVALVLEMKSDVSEGVIKQALGKLAQAHPLLRMKIVKKEGVPTFEPMTESPVNFKSVDSSSWEKVLSQEVDTKFDVAGGPLWRAVLLPNAVTIDVTPNKKPSVSEEEEEEASYSFDSVLILSFHRSVVDEGFVAELCAQFLRVLNHEMGDDTQPLEEHPDLLPALDVNFTKEDVPEKWYEAMSKKIHAITEKRVENIGEINENQPKPKEITLVKKEVENLPQEIICKKLDRDLTLKFFNKCAQFDVAISAALEVAAVLAFAHDEKKKDDVLPMQIEQSIFLKPMLPAIPLAYCGNYSVENVIDTAVPRGSSFMESYWNLAMSVTEGLATTMQTAMPIVDAGLPPELTIQTDEKSADEAGKTTPPADADPEPGTPEPPVVDFKNLRVSTMGACSEGSHTKNPTVRIKGLFGHIGLRADGPSIAHCHTAVNEQLCWTLTYKRGKSSKKEAQELVQKTIDCISKALPLNPSPRVKVEGVTPSTQDASV